MALPLWEMKISKAPIAIIKGGDRQLMFYKIKKFSSKFFAIKDNSGSGLVFELDDRYEYRYKNTSVYFYNFSNFKPLLLSGVAEIDKKLSKEGKSQLENVDDVIRDLTEEQIQAFSDKIKDPKEGLSPETKRFLEDYYDNDEKSKTEMFISLHMQKSPIPYYSSPLIGMGFNSGHFAIIQIGHKKLDIVPMYHWENRAYTEYGVFNFTIDNLYLVKKQIVAFFILNDTEDSISQAVPKPVSRQIKQMAKRRKWSFLETFNKPKRTRVKEPKIGFKLQLQEVNIEDDEDAKTKINNAIKPKPKKIEPIPETPSDIDYKILQKLSVTPPAPKPPVPEPVVEEPIDDVYEDESDYSDNEMPEEEPVIEEHETLEIENDDIDIPEPEPEKITLDMDDPTGPPK